MLVYDVLVVVKGDPLGKCIRNSRNKGTETRSYISRLYIYAIHLWTVFFLYFSFVAVSSTVAKSPRELWSETDNLKKIWNEVEWRGIFILLWTCSWTEARKYFRIPAFHSQNESTQHISQNSWNNAYWI